MDWGCAFHLGSKASAPSSQFHQQRNRQEVKLCNYTDVYYNEFITADLPFMQATASKDEISQFTLKKGDLIITKDSEDPSDIGIPALVVEDAPGVVCGYHLTLIRSAELVTARLLHRVLQSTPTHAYFYIESPGITRYGLGKDVIGDLRVCMPPENEIARIADCIDKETKRIDSLITKKTRFIELLKEKRQALIKGIDPKVKMKPSGVEWIGEVPEHWKLSKLGFEMTERGGKTPSTVNDEYWGGDVPWVSPKDMKVEVISNSIDKITDLAVSECGMALIEANSVLVVVRGMILAHSFPVAETARAVTINQDMKALLPSSRITATYLRLVLQSAKSYVVSVLVAEAAHGTCVLRTDVWKQLPVSLPPLPEQIAITNHVANTLARFDRLLIKTQHSIDLLKERRSAFITAAVTGQIDLREAA
jgi:type I restriction enzyme S subunit